MSRDLVSRDSARTKGRAGGALEPVRVTSVRGLDAGWCSHRGHLRPENEDAIAVTALPSDAGLLIVLSDGMGGHAGGEVASRLVCERVLRVAADLAPSRPLRERYEALHAALVDADRLVRAAAAERDELGDMGATVVAAAVTSSRALHLYAGDSRLYLIRQGQRSYRTQDQTVVGLLRHYGQLTESEAFRHPQRHRLLSFVGGGGNRSRCEPAPAWPRDAAACEADLALAPRDTLLLCSDGLNGQVTDARIAELAGRADVPASTLAASLVEAALEAGGEDNVTVCVVRVGDA